MLPPHQLSLWGAGTASLIASSLPSPLWIQADLAGHSWPRTAGLGEHSGDPEEKDESS